MANMSDAHGTIEIMANDVKIIDDIFYLIDECLDGCDYYTEVIDELEGLKLKELNDEYKYSKEATFDACGRWSYLTNIENLFKWIKGNGKDLKVTSLLDELKDKDFKIIFDYVDREPGCEIFGRYVHYIVHKGGEVLTECQVYDGDFEGYEECIVDYCEYLGLDFNEAVEELGYKFDLDDEEDVSRFKEELLSQKDDIERYFKKSFEQLVSIDKNLEKFLSGE